MPFGQTRGVTVVDGVKVVLDGNVVEGTVVEGTTVEGTAVDCGTVGDRTDEVDGVVEGEILGGWPTMLLPPLALSSVGVEPTLLPNWLGGVPVMLGCGVTPNGEVVVAPGVVGDVVPIPGVVVMAPGVVAAAPGAAAPAPALPAPVAPTWAKAGSVTAARSASGRRRGSSMEISFVTSLSRDIYASFIPRRGGSSRRQALENPRCRLQIGFSTPLSR